VRGKGKEKGKKRGLDERAYCLSPSLLHPAIAPPEKQLKLHKYDLMHKD